MTKFVIIKNISNEKQQPVKPQTQNTIPSIKQKSSLIETGFLFLLQRVNS